MASGGSRRKSRLRGGVKRKECSVAEKKGGGGPPGTIRDPAISFQKEEAHCP